MSTLQSPTVHTGDRPGSFRFVFMSIPTKCTVHPTPSTAVDRTLNFRPNRCTSSAFDYASRWLESWSCSQVEPAAMPQVSVSWQRAAGVGDVTATVTSTSLLALGSCCPLPSFCHRRCCCQRFVLVPDLMLLRVGLMA